MDLDQTVMNILHYLFRMYDDDEEELDEFAIVDVVPTNETRTVTVYHCLK